MTERYSKRQRLEQLGHDELRARLTDRVLYHRIHRPRSLHVWKAAKTFSPDRSWPDIDGVPLFYHEPLARLLGRSLVTRFTLDSRKIRLVILCNCDGGEVSRMRGYDPCA